MNRSSDPAQGRAFAHAAILFLSPLLLPTAGLAGQTPARAAEPTPGAPLIVPRLAGPITLDGGVDASARSSASPTTRRKGNFTWNTFWDAAVHQDEGGWYAEIRVPLSSLRFQDEDGRPGAAPQREPGAHHQVRPHPDVLRPAAPSGAFRARVGRSGLP